jgi:hypothetical protein
MENFWGHEVERRAEVLLQRGTHQRDGRVLVNHLPEFTHSGQKIKPAETPIAIGSDVHDCRLQATVVDPLVSVTENKRLCELS